MVQRRTIFQMLLATGLLAVSTLGAQAPPAQTPPAPDRTPIPGRGNAEPVKLLFHEAWTRAPLTQPMVQENLGNQNLTLHIYGNASEIRKTMHPNDDYTYTGEATTNWAITVSDKANFWNLT